MCDLILVTTGPDATGTQPGMSPSTITTAHPVLDVTNATATTTTAAPVELTTPAVTVHTLVVDNTSSVVTLVVEEATAGTDATTTQEAGLYM